jgi:hypothetical protein
MFDIEQLTARQHQRGEMLTPEQREPKPTPWQEQNTGGGVIMKLTGGPNGNHIYTCRKQRVTDFNTFEADADVNNYSLYFIGIGTSNLPGAASGQPWSGKYCKAFYEGQRSGVGIYHCYDLPSATIGLVADPT